MSECKVACGIAADVGGDGPPLVLLHSLLSDRASFDRIRAPLAERFRVIVPDLPGFGRSEPVSGALPEVADRIAQALRAFCGEERPVVLGNGYGGFVALQMAMRHPSLATRLILADCGAAFSEPGRAAFRTMASVSAAKGLQAIADTAMRRLFSPDFQAAMPALMLERRAAFLGTHPDIFREACKALAELDLRPRLSEILCPVLVLVGENDEATPPPMSEELARLLPDARLIVIPGCAHVPQLQAPDLFLAAITPYLSAGFGPDGER